MPLPGENADEIGVWSDVFPWPLIGLHAVVTPDGKILSFGTDQDGIQTGLHIYDVWDPVTDTHTTLEHTTHSDLFCSVALIIPETGQILISGGDARPLGAPNAGIPDVNIFDSDEMTLEHAPTGPMAFARWYPTMLTLATGQFVVLGGRDGDFNYNGYSEIYTPGYGFRTLTGAYIDDYSMISDYPRSWVASSGEIITFAANGTVSKVYAIDPTGSGHVEVIGQLPSAISWYQPAIMFDQDRTLLVADDGSVWIMDISGATPAFERTDDLGTDRKWSNLVVLPDGRVMASGGSAVANELSGVDNTVQIWDPSTGHWSDEAEAAVPRLYHSITVLLPDGTVLSMAGGAPGPLVNTNAEIYSPNYLFAEDGGLAVRPLITQAPQELDVGQDFAIQVDNPASIRSLALMASGSVTHAFNMAARRLELDFQVQTDGSLSVDLPDNANVLTPGYWMLFAIDSAGTPSLASTIQIHSKQDYYFHDRVPLELDVNLVANGRAAYDGFDDTYVLTPNALFKSGSVFTEQRVDLLHDFDLTFEIYLGNDDAAADGMAFVLHNDSRGSSTLGGTGGTLGAIGIANGLGIEFDIYQNSEITGELANDHTSFFDTDVLTADPSVSPVTDLGNIEDGQWHTARVNWDGQTLSYWVDGNQIATLNQDIAATYLGGSSLAYLGFTASTGGGATEQKVRIVALDATLEDGTPVIADRAGLPRSPTFQTNGDAAFHPLANSYSLVSNTLFKSGSVFTEQRVDLLHDFDLTFEIYLGNDDAAADGMAFVLHNDSRGSSTLGGTGGTLGAIGIANGLGIEFDIYQNSEITGELANDHTSFFDTDVLTADPSVSPVTDLGNIEDGQWHTARVNWDGQTLSYWVDGNQIATLNQDIAATYLGGSSLAYLGFTASTGGGATEQKVRVVDFEATAEDGSVLHAIGRNAAPIAVEDSYTIAENGVLTVSVAGGILANDSDPDGDAVAICEDSHLLGHNVLLTPHHGTLTMNVDGSFTYTPEAGFVGVDQFHYCIDDDYICVEGEATITVTAGSNHSPTLVHAIGDQSASTGQMYALGLPADTFADPDAGDTLTLTTTALPAWLAFDAVERSFSGTPGPGDVGSLDVTVTATDQDGASVSDTFTIEVAETNDDPVITSDGGGVTASIKLAENMANVTTVVAVDADAGQTLTYAIVGGADAAKFTMDPGIGTLSFISAPDYENRADADGDNVYDVIVQVADDKGGVATQSIAVTATNINEASVGGVLIASFAANANNTASLTAANTISDPDGLVGAITYQWQSFNGITWANIAGATSATFTNGAAQVNKPLRVVAISADPFGASSNPSTNTAIVGNASGNTLTGTAEGNLIIGLAGNDTLDGGADVNTLVGGAGNDIYVADGLGNTIVENVGEGTDTVFTASASYSLALVGNVENLTHTGSGDFAGSGNDLPNTVTGSLGNDVLDGGVGADRLLGGAGNDTYVVDNALDKITETSNAGTDLVRTSLTSYTLGANVENLTYAGSGNFTGAGNGLANVLTGGNGVDKLTGAGGADTLTGGIGDDTLMGGAGTDTFIFRPGFGKDTIGDFQIGNPNAHDTLDLMGLGFTTIEDVLDHTDLGANAVIHAGVDMITLQGVTKAQLQSHLFDLLI